MAGWLSVGKPVPLGKCSNKKRWLCKALGESSAPTESISLAGVVWSSAQAASIALYSMVFLSGLNSNWRTMGAMDVGSLPDLSSST